MSKRIIVAALALALLATPAAAQDWGRSTADVEGPPAVVEDVESIDAIIAALYDVISGPAGQARDWDRMRSLFLPEARLIPSGTAPDGSTRYLAWSVEDYISNAGGQLEANGFFETESHRVEERFGNIAHVFSTYDSYRTADEKAREPFMRGINSIQLLYDGERWWVLQVFWQAESSETPIPERYLGEG
jgi:hypothetical protein